MKSILAYFNRRGLPLRNGDHPQPGEVVICGMIMYICTGHNEAGPVCDRYWGNKLSEKECQFLYDKSNWSGFVIQ